MQLLAVKNHPIYFVSMKNTHMVGSKSFTSLNQVSASYSSYSKADTNQQWDGRALALEI